MVLTSALAAVVRAETPEAAPTATALVEQAARAYDGNQWDEALRLLARAYELSPRPSIVYNQAQVMRAKGDCPGALDAYARFLATTTPADSNHQRALLRRTEMQTCVDQKIGAGGNIGQAPVRTRPPEYPRRGTSRSAHRAQQSHGRLSWVNPTRTPFSCRLSQTRRGSGRRCAG